MTADYDRRIARAEELAAVHPESAELLGFYCGLARIQREVFRDIFSGYPSDLPKDWPRDVSIGRSSGKSDFDVLMRHFPRLIELVEHAGPEHLAAFARERLGGPPEWKKLLTGNWEGDRTAPVEAQFFARVLLQPFAESLADRATQSIVGKHVPGATCPFCTAKPVVAVLRGEGEGARRSLICSLCSTEWLYRRVVCPNCGEENKDQLPVYIAEETAHVREAGFIRTPEAGYIRGPQASHINVAACDTCKSYLKSIDLTKNGHAVPVVDELATVALNIWAEERGYAKLETNLLGM